MKNIFVLALALAITGQAFANDAKKEVPAAPKTEVPAETPAETHAAPAKHKGGHHKAKKEAAPKAE